MAGTVPLAYRIGSDIHALSGQPCLGLGCRKFSLTRGIGLVHFAASLTDQLASGLLLIVRHLTHGSVQLCEGGLLTEVLRAHLLQCSGVSGFGNRSECG